jgi:hypothetical protein
MVTQDGEPTSFPAVHAAWNVVADQLAAGDLSRRREWSPALLRTPGKCRDRVLPDTVGSVESLVLHQGGDHPAKKRAAN